jgi:serine/threonine-protein kinase RsbW
MRFVNDQAVLRLTSAVADLAQLYPWLEQAASDTPIAADVLARMHLVLEEVVANVASHGFSPDQTGQIVIRLTVGSDAAVLEVEDNGMPFNPTTAPLPPAPKSLSDAVPGGAGLRLIRRFCQSIAYQQLHPINHLTMKFPIQHHAD